MTVSPVVNEKPAVKHRRRSPLLVGLVMLAVLAAGYLGWQHFTQRPGAAPEPPAPVPVIATTVKQQNFPIVLTGIGNVTALNSATVRSWSRSRSSASTSRTASSSRKASFWPSSIRAPIRRSSTRRRPISPATRLISKMGGSISAGISRCKNKALRRRNRSPRSKRRSLRKRPRSKAIRRRSNTPRPSWATRSWWRRSTGSPEFACSMSATSSTRARHGVLRASRTPWW